VLTTHRPDIDTDPISAATAPTRPVVGASVDIGSNSVHLLVATIVGHRLEPLVDESVFLGLGSGVVQRGSLGRAARAELAETLAIYAATARGLDAAHITLLGTEPIRRAADAARIVHEVGIASGAPLHVLSHEEEAYLTLIGVTEGMPVTHETLVIDIGGGSSEFCIVDATRPPRAAGLRLGSAGLTDRFVTHDPPTASELAAMRAAALVALREAPDAQPREIVAVGGTASNLLKLLPDAAIDGILTRERIANAEAILAAEPAAEASIRHGVKPIRARLLPAGGTIMAAILDRYGADWIRVKDAGIREGAILAVEHAGISWRDRLAELAHGWRT
jgi:exopolyphosphatase/guanosine-5'-triphosphate,3'-diphosphate pyrophosphatase